MRRDVTFDRGTGEGTVRDRREGRPPRSPVQAGELTGETLPMLQGVRAAPPSPYLWAFRVLTERRPT